MVLQALTSFLYEWVSSSWMIATLTLHVVLLLHLVKLGVEKELSFERFEEMVVRYSRIVVLGIVVLGLVSHLIGFQMQPPLKLFSQFIALFYFGFLFWRF